MEPFSHNEMITVSIGGAFINALMILLPPRPFVSPHHDKNQRRCPIA